MYDIIFISGKKGSGKDTIAYYIADRYKYYKVALADVLKNMTVDFFKLFYNFDLKKQVLYDQYKKDNLGFLHDRQHRITAKTKPRFALRKNESFKPYRGYLTGIADILQEHISIDIWAQKLYHKIEDILKEDKNNKIIISDIRYPADYEYFMKKFNHLSTISIHVTGSYKNHSYLDDDNITEKPHPSEIEMDNIKFDKYIINDGSLNDLYDKIDKIINSKKKEIKIMNV